LTLRSTCPSIDGTGKRESAQDDDKPSGPDLTLTQAFRATSDHTLFSTTIIIHSFIISIIVTVNKNRLLIWRA
jgi:hypothetical protein